VEVAELPPLASVPLAPAAAGLTAGAPAVDAPPAGAPHDDAAGEQWMAASESNKIGAQDDARE
jgi:hypothetical protein